LEEEVVMSDLDTNRDARPRRPADPALENVIVAFEQKRREQQTPGFIFKRDPASEQAFLKKGAERVDVSNGDDMSFRPDRQKLDSAIDKPKSDIDLGKGEKPFSMQRNPSMQMFLIKQAENSAKDEFKEACQPALKLAAEAEEALKVAKNPNASLEKRQEALGKSQSIASKMQKAWTVVEKEAKPGIMSKFDNAVHGMSALRTRQQLDAQMVPPAPIAKLNDGIEATKDNLYHANLAAQRAPSRDRNTRYEPGPGFRNQ
jgi:vacuolar-type H+-ATPase subunit H